MAGLTRRTLLGAGLVGVAAAAAQLAEARARTPAVYQDRNGVAVDGTDVVAYFTQGRPVRGSAEFTHRWNGATWRFSTSANRDAFAADPARYAPQYGGWCAWAVSQGYTASTVPEAWTIVDGRLFLNYSRRIHRTWARNAAAHIAAADRNWPAILD